MIELNEGSVKDFIKQGKVVIKVWSKKCGFCDKFAPIVDEAEKELPEVKFGAINIDYNDTKPSEFRDAYVKKPTAPVLVVFENGVMKHRYYGFMNSKELVMEFVKTGARDNSERNLVAQPQKQMPYPQEMHEVYARKGFLVTQSQLINEEIKALDEKIGESMRKQQG